MNTDALSMIELAENRSPKAEFLDDITSVASTRTGESFVSDLYTVETPLFSNRGFLSEQLISYFRNIRAESITLARATRISRGLDKEFRAVTNGSKLIRVEVRSNV